MNIMVRLVSIADKAFAIVAGVLRVMKRREAASEEVQTLKIISFVLRIPKSSWHGSSDQVPLKVFCFLLSSCSALE